MCYIHSCKWSPITLYLQCQYAFPNLHSEHQASSSVSGVMYSLPFNDGLVSSIYKTLSSLGRHYCNPVRYGKTTFLRRNCTMCSCNFGKSRNCHPLHGKSLLNEQRFSGMSPKENHSCTSYSQKMIIFLVG